MGSTGLRVELVVESEEGEIRARIPILVLKELLEAQGVDLGPAWDKSLQRIEGAVMERLRK